MSFYHSRDDGSIISEIHNFLQFLTTDTVHKCISQIASCAVCRYYLLLSIIIYQENSFEPHKDLKKRLEHKDEDYHLIKIE